MNDRTLDAIRIEVAALNAYHLASMADCSSPDSGESAGAEMLSRVADAFVEAFEFVRPDDIAEWIADAGHEIADGAPSIYTHAKWAQFVDLGAYQEDPSELGAEASDMDQSASICLYMIAERLAHALAELAQSIADAIAELEADENGAQ